MVRRILPLVGLALLASCAPAPGKGHDTDLPDTDAADTDVGDTDVAIANPGPEAHELDVLRAASTIPVWGSIRDGLPRTLLMDVPLSGTPATDPVGSLLGFFEANKDLYRLSDPANELHPARVTDSTGGHALRWRQHVRGVEVMGAMLNAVYDDDSVLLTHGQWIPDLATVIVDVIPTLSPTDAVAAAAAVDEVPLGAPQLRVADSRLVRDLPDGTFLVWDVTLSTESTSRQVLVDAHDGTILRARSLEHDAAPSHDFNVYWEGGRPARTSFERLFYTEAGTGPDYVAGVDDLHEASACATHIKALDDFYWTHFSRFGYDDDGGSLDCLVDLVYLDSFLQPAPNAHGNGGTGVIEFHRGILVDDIIGHEYTHTWEHWASDLTYDSESGALAESVADVFGSAYERSRGDTDWLMGDGNSFGALRDLSNPSARGQPDNVDGTISTDGKGEIFVPSSQDSGGVHKNSGIPNKAAWLLMAGGDAAGVHVEKVGESLTQRLLYTSLSLVVGSDDQFRDFADAVYAVAYLAEHGLFPLQGNDPGDAPARFGCNVQNAYAAVGMNAGVVDSDCDGTPDAQDNDVDGDLVPNSDDNCRFVANPFQQDTDSDGKGDACDNDIDGDYVANARDNCPTVKNPEQYDLDGNGKGDACDDQDHDTWTDATDNCITVANADQLDFDHDRKGDDCDDDADGDGILNVNDDCPLKPSHNGDADSDGVGDDCDNCPDVANADQEDCNGNGVGRACDTQFELCRSDVDKTTRGQISKGAVLPIPPTCASCADQLGRDWVQDPAVAIDVTALAGVDLLLVGPGGTVYGRTGGAAHTTFSLAPGMGFSYRAPGAATWASYDTFALQLAPGSDAAASATIAVAVH